MSARAPPARFSASRSFQSFSTYLMTASASASLNPAPARRSRFVVFSGISAATAREMLALYVVSSCRVSFQGSMNSYPFIRFGRYLRAVIKHDGDNHRGVIIVSHELEHACYNRFDYHRVTEGVYEQFLLIWGGDWR